MKYIIILFFSISLLACQSGNKKSSDVEGSDLDLPNSDLYEPLDSEASSEDENYQVALDFINSYIESINHLEILEFARKSPLATDKLKTELENIVILAWEANPRIGLLADPLVDAQDYPSEGFELDTFDPKTGYVMVKGIDWEDFKVAMRVVNENGHILVDGCGAVNMPENKRAER
ncbi:MAG: hypothetical protein ACOH2D_04895 [Gelidibacter sp.]